MAILTSCSGYEPFHKNGRGRIPGISVADFLIFDSIFPRSVRFCLEQCQGRPTRSRAGPSAGRATRSSARSTTLLRWLNLTRIDDFVEAGLHEALTSVIDRIHEIGDAIHRTYFDQRSSLNRRRAGRGQTTGPVPQSQRLTLRRQRATPLLVSGATRPSRTTRLAHPGAAAGPLDHKPGHRLSMAIRVALNHKTTYRYDRPVTLLPHVVRLRPAPHCRTPILSYSLRVEPQPALPQLAAGSLQQLPRAAGLPRSRRRAARSRSTSSPR